MRESTLRCLLLFVLLAAPGTPRAGPADELKELRARIEALQKQLAESEESRSFAADALKESERAISGTNRRLFELAGENRDVRAALQDIGSRKAQLAGSVESHQRLLANLLYRQYLAGQPEPLRLLLNRQDPNELGRQMHYLSYVSKARAQLIEALRQDLASVETLSKETEAKLNQLARLQAEQAQQRAQLERDKRARQAVLAKVSSAIEKQRREITNYKRNEERLTQLVEKLAKELEERRRARAAKRPGPLRNEALPEANAEAAAFRELKGKLKLPVIGELTNRFGSPREDSGLSWKGLFILARPGVEVRAVAPGRVVFADWLRGFGNLLILDHGGGYMSLYGNNESLYRQVGDSVKTADSVAAVGSSGGNTQSGLYFELRFQGKPIDPLGWVSLK
jgi:septal ring factor EnvC (AmiA/AmiB activator)